MLRVNHTNVRNTHTVGNYGGVAIKRKEKEMPRSIDTRTEVEHNNKRHKAM